MTAPVYRSQRGSHGDSSLHMLANGQVVGIQYSILSGMIDVYKVFRTEWPNGIPAITREFILNFNEENAVEAHFAQILEASNRFHGLPESGHIKFNISLAESDRFIVEESTRCE
ncbi:predicted protein [Histoplasma capsulatum var. duboisii H88]|uniref:Predicted protein n=1 Tax=Ajellomyces capsulatus (strain H88) TaxID=544711 RepID=F0UFP3_AJEC8|nr:predicted protein [Histoplasma capsulatum var. duboisii H88]